MSVNLPFGIYVAGNDPLDLRTVVDDIPARDQLIADGLVFEGMKIYVKSEKKSYLLTGATSADFEEVETSTGTPTSDWTVTGASIEPTVATEIKGQDLRITNDATVDGELTIKDDILVTGDNSKMSFTGPTVNTAGGYTVMEFPDLGTSKFVMNSEFGPVFKKLPALGPGTAPTQERIIAISPDSGVMLFSIGTTNSNDWKQVQSTTFSSGAVYKENITPYTGDPFGFLNAFQVREFDYTDQSFTPHLKNVVGVIADEVAGTVDDILVIYDRAGTTPLSLDWNWIHGYYIKAHQVTKQTTDTLTTNISTLSQELTSLEGTVTGLASDVAAMANYYAEDDTETTNTTDVFTSKVKLTETLDPGDYLVKATYEAGANVITKDINVAIQVDGVTVSDMVETPSSATSYSLHSVFKRITHAGGPLSVDMLYRIINPTGTNEVKLRNARLLITKF